MFWWKGKGLIIGLIVAALIVGAAKSGKYGVAIGLLGGAVMSFVLKDWEEGSSLYSIPVKIWPYPLLALAALTAYQAYKMA